MSRITLVVGIASALSLTVSIVVASAPSRRVDAPPTISIASDITTVEAGPPSGHLSPAAEDAQAEAAPDPVGTRADRTAANPWPVDHGRDPGPDRTRPPEDLVQVSQVGVAQYGGDLFALATIQTP